MLWTFITSRFNNLWTGSSWARWQDPNCFEQSWHGGSSGVQYPVWLCTMWNVICTLYNIHILYKCEMTIMQMITTIQISGANEGLWCSDVELGQGTLKFVTGFPQISTWCNTYLVPPGAWHTRGGQGLHWQLLGSAVKVGKAVYVLNLPFMKKISDLMWTSVFLKQRSRTSLQISSHFPGWFETFGEDKGGLKLNTF